MSIINCIMECDSHVWMGSREIKPIASRLPLWFPSNERNSEAFHADQLASINLMIFNSNLAGLRINPMPWGGSTPLVFLHISEPLQILLWKSLPYILFIHSSTSTWRRAWKRRNIVCEFWVRTKFLSPQATFLRKVARTVPLENN